MTQQNSIIHLKGLVSNNLTKVDNYILNLARSDLTDLIPSIVSYIINAGGKRLRPILTLACAQMHYCKDDASILLATAVEFIHTATLLHDDVIDESHMRRNLKTANNIWGNKQSILVGDYLFSQAFKLMVQTKSLKALSILSTASALIAESEVWQLQLIGKIDITFEEYLQLITAKTATLFAAACCVGGIAANVTDTIESSLYNFGINFGIVFQIMDDLLDYLGERNEIGKNTGNDFIERKVTLPAILLYQTLAEKEKSIIKDYFMHTSNTSFTFFQIKNLLIKYNIKEKVLEIANFYLHKAENYLTMSGGDPKFQDVLQNIISESVKKS